MKTITNLKAGGPVFRPGPSIVVNPHIALNLAIIVQIGNGNSAGIGQSIH